MATPIPAPISTGKPVHVLYFAWLRERAGRAEERVPLPTGIDTVAALIAHLRQQDNTHNAVFSDIEVIRCAVNQEMAAFTTVIRPGDEIAFFPPVTGG